MSTAKPLLCADIIATTLHAYGVRHAFGIPGNDVLELIRASSATLQACLDETLQITTKLPSGYQRDLQRLKAPLFRGIDLAIESVDIMAHLLDGMNFIPENITLDPGIHAAEEANRLVRDEGIPFREAYKRVGEKFAK